MRQRRSAPPTPTATGTQSAWIPARPDRRGAAPARLSDVLVGAELYAQKRSGTAMPRAEWVSIVGPRIAGRTRLGKIYKGVLTIKVASSSWSNELSFLKSELLVKLRRAGHDIVDLRFSVDKIENVEKRPQRRGTPVQATSQTPLPRELLERLEQVDDPNLRAAIAEAARASLKKAR